MAQAASEGTTIELPFRPPYQWDVLAAFLAGRALAGVEDARPDSYRRTIALGGAYGLVEVRPVAGKSHLLANIRLPPGAALDDVERRLARVFDLDAAPEEIAALLGRDPALAPTVAALPGLRVPGAWDPFELAVRGILGQQVSVAAARTLASRVVAAHGAELALPGAPPGLSRVFPTPQALAEADLTGIGLPAARARAVSGLAFAVARDPQLLTIDDGAERLIARLCALPGIGPWTAQYVALRGFGDPDAFPASDLGVLQALRRLGVAQTAAEAAARAERWRPWRAYATLYLWHSHLAPSSAAGSAESPT